MFKNDRMMMILTGLVLAIFAGTLVKYGDRIMALMSGESEIASQDDSYSVRAGSLQILDVQSNDVEKGPIVVLSRPSCGTVELTGNNKVSFSSAQECQGPVEFAYCVDANGICEPNTVRINVISVGMPPQTRTASASQPADTEDTAPSETRSASSSTPLEVASEAPQASGEFSSAPAVGTISTSMAPPSLAAPSIPELVSPSIAMASIRQSSGGLTTQATTAARTSNTDQNIAAQNSAEVAQTATAAPSTFQAPSIGESSNISLGGGASGVTASVAAPQGLQPSAAGEQNITNLERGPVALAALPNNRSILPAQESAPLATNPERSNFAPTEVAAAQTSTPEPDSRFSAAPRHSGPIALIALQGASSGNAAGERLNVILTEPGEQNFTSAQVPPATLAPASGGLTSVSVLEREPNAMPSVDAPSGLAFENGAAVLASAMQDRSVIRIARPQPSTPTVGTVFDGPRHILAANPNQVSIPQSLDLLDRMNRDMRLSTGQDPLSRALALGNVAAPSASGIAPEIDMTPAQTPQILQASLPATTAPLVNNTPPQQSACDIDLAASTRNGALISLDIAAPCKPSQMVTIEHSGLEFSVLTDAAGLANVTFPAMQQDAEISARFEDQSRSTTSIMVNDIDRVLRAGVSWRSEIDLNLNAFEYGAGIGSEGHVSQDAPRDYRSSRIKGGGYLLQLGDPLLGRGSLAEVYTIPVNRNQQRGTVSLSVVISEPRLVCGQTIVAKTVRSREGRSAGIRNVRFTVPACGSVAGQIALPGALDDIRLAGR